MNVLGDESPGDECRTIIYEGVEILLWFCNILKVCQKRGKGLLRWGKWKWEKVGGIDDGSGVEEGGAMGGEGRIDGVVGEGGGEASGEKEKQVNLLPHQHFSWP